MHLNNIIEKFKWKFCKIVSFIGIDMYEHTDDRRVLETIILPYFIQRNEYFKILFVGCAWYTRGYNKLFKNKEYWTLESDPTQGKYGSASHITDNLENVRHYFSEGGIDLIICNGVFGWGLNTRDNVEKAFQACYESLRNNGVLILGWNDIPERKPFSLEECQSLRLFKPYVFSPLSKSQYLTDTLNNHTFNFYIKKM